MFKNEDFIELINSKSLFTRKLDINIDIEVVEIYMDLLIANVSKSVTVDNK